MSIAFVTGSAGLIGSETCRRLHAEGMDIVGIDNDMRAFFFGHEASTDESRRRLKNDLPRYQHFQMDIRVRSQMEELFSIFGKDITAIIHTAAQPSHDWAVRDPFIDFGVNAVGTLNLLECARKYCPDAPFIFTSTSKVYGDNPNQFPFIEKTSRMEPVSHYTENGFTEALSIDQCKHSLFGASKVAADILVQEYGKYFGMKTVCFRPGCLTGPNHAGAELHGFLAYLMKCTMEGMPYRVIGYKGKQVRCNIHSADLVDAFWHFLQAPRSGEVYNIGGGRKSNCSILEAIDLCERITGKRLDWSYVEEPRIGDHIWWISSNAKFQSHYPAWKVNYDTEAILRDIFNRREELSSPALSAT